MQDQPIPIKILGNRADFHLVQLPYLEIPVEMSPAFLQHRLASGYYQIVEAFPDNNDFTDAIHEDTHSVSTQVNPLQQQCFSSYS